MIRDAAGTMNILFIISFILAGFLLSFFDLSISYKLLVFLIPLSVKFTFPNSTATILLPSEFLTGLLAIAFCFSYFFKVPVIDKQFLKHPLTILIVFYVFFLIISAAFSGMPIVSLKAVIVKTTYMIVFYFLTYMVLKKDALIGSSFFVIYGMALIPVIMFTLMNHSIYGFSKDTSNTATLPFFSDHTIYSACISFIIPPLIIHLIFSKSLRLSRVKIILFSILILWLCVGVFFSYCRASWLSLAAGGLFCIMILMRIKIKWLIILFLSASLFTIFNRNHIVSVIKQNKSDSNAKNADLIQQTKSIANITNDLSNAERINRWSCAVRMFCDKPYTGFGIGTYQFEYLHYQRKKEMTSLSVNSPYNNKSGRGGSAHSEYLLVLSESGVFAFLSFIGIILSALYIGMKTYYGRDSQNSRIVSLMALSGLVTYLSHSLFNNFLDVDKAAFLFWSSLSMLTAASISMKQSAS
ncbi:MAG TPA: O-antigen ligase family protein [Bacteroidia bacterium]|nr:O-antigen ligase family protein [Bacteroidia bacterium]